MSDRPRLARRAIALALSALLLADVAALTDGSGIAAAPAPEASPTALPASDPGGVLGDPGGALSDPGGALSDPGGALGDPEDAPACDAGFGTTDTKAGLALLGVTLTGRGALAVGFSRINQGDDIGTRRPAAVVRAGDGWSRVPASSRGNEDGLVAVTAAGGGSAWAVGFTSAGPRTMPLAMYWNGQRWKVDSPRPERSLTATLTDVAMVGSWPFAVGYRQTSGGGSKPVAALREGRRWRYVSPRTGRRESMSLTGVSGDRRGGLWVVGYGGPGTELQPVIYRRAKGDWSRQRAPRVRAEGVLSDVVATAADDAWAVGYRRTGTRSVPLVLHWDGRDWQRARAPDFGSDEAVLTAVSTSPSGGVWAVGAAWDSEALSHRAVAAWWDGRAWNRVASVDTGTELHDVTGSPDVDGWTVGRTGLRSLTARVCLPAQAGVFGSYEDEADDLALPTDDDLALPPDDDLALPPDHDLALPTNGDLAAVAVAGTSPATATAAGGQASGATAAGGRSAPQARTERARFSAAARRRTDRGRPNRRQRGRRAPRRGLSDLPEARPDGRILARNVAPQVGLADTTATYGGIADDFDGDGVEDLFIGRHGRPARLALNRGGRFVDHEAITFPPTDRHGCAAADIDGSGLPDIFCTIGGKRGSGLKSDELWLDPGGPAPTQSAIELGLSDPTGRGRRAAFLESTLSDRIDLVVTNSPVRIDGLPSVGRLYRRGDDGMFNARVRTGFASRLGSLSLGDDDYDGDGREDLLLVTGGPQAPAQQGMHLYRNTADGLVEVTRQMGVRDIDDVDAELVDLDGDRRLDLVQLSPSRLRISLQRSGEFRVVYERKVSYGRAVTGGDVDGDGDEDLYIVRGNGVRNHPDVMLLDRDGGRSWSSMLIPQVGGGLGEDAVAIDHDGNGLDDFLVLNGHNDRGPVQLIAFYARKR